MTATRADFLCCLRLLVSGRSAACPISSSWLSLSELSIVPFEARYRFRGSLACIGSRATYFFMMERIRTHLYSIGSLASSSKLGALRDAASLTWPEKWDGSRGVAGMKWEWSNWKQTSWLDFKKWEWNGTEARGQLATLGNPKVQPNLSQKPYPFVSTSQPRAMNPTRISVCKDLEPPALNPSLFFQCFQSRAKLPAFLLAHGEDMQSRQQLTCIPLQSPPPPGEAVLVRKVQLTENS